MKYDIFYRPTFTKRTRALAGYEMAVYAHDDSRAHEDFDVITIEPVADNEFNRFEKMLKGEYDPFGDIAFVDKHPLSILRYLRGEREPVMKNDDWESEIDRWKVNIRGERV